MATIVNNPGETRSSSGTLLAVIVALVLAVLLFVYGLPYVRSYTGGTQINVPGQVDVNVNQPQAQ